jgi:hypothetical protein
MTEDVPPGRLYLRRHSSPLRHSYLLLCHSRQFLSGIYLGFLSDGYSPQTAGITEGEMKARVQLAGGTDKNDLAALRRVPVPLQLSFAPMELNRPT